MNKTVSWPAIIKMEGVDDLLYIESQQVWDSEASISQQYHRDDLLIDSEGHCFQLQIRASDIDIVAMQQSLDLAQLDQWVRQHLVAMQQCCVYKVELDSFEQGFHMVKDTQESD